jgi:oligopeptide transport system permease protein
MFAFFLRRLFGMVLVFWAVVTLTYLLVWVAPGDPFVREKDLSEATKEQLKAQYKIDGRIGKLWDQYQKDHQWKDLKAWGIASVQDYGRYMADLAHGDLRISLKFKGRSVNQLLADGLPVSATLGITALLLATCGGIWLGTIAAVRQHSFADAGAMLAALALISVPTFVVGPLLALVFAIRLGWLPVGGWTSWTSLILPAITLSGPYTAYIARLMRSSLLEVLSQDFIRTARAKGLDEAGTVYRHGLKVAILPVDSFLGPLTANLLTGSLVVETIFNIPGAGPYFVQSILNSDRYLLMGVTIVYCGLLIVLNFLTDLTYTWLDRRIRLNE